MFKNNQQETPKCMVDRAKLVGSFAVATKYHLQTFTWHQLYDIDKKAWLWTATKNRLRLPGFSWFSIIKDGIIDITATWLFLYPDDSDRQGTCSVSSNNTMVSNGAINIDEAIEKEATHILPTNIQINDTTHQWLVRIDPSLTASWYRAWRSNSPFSMDCHTNHTTAEALENGLLNFCVKKWFFTWYQSSKNWNRRESRISIQLFKLLMRWTCSHGSHGYPPIQ